MLSSFSPYCSSSSCFSRVGAINSKFGPVIIRAPRAWHSSRRRASYPTGVSNGDKGSVVRSSRTNFAKRGIYLIEIFTFPILLAAFARVSKNARSCNWCATRALTSPLKYTSAKGPYNRYNSSIEFRIYPLDYVTPPRDDSINASESHSVRKSKS